MNNPAPRKRSPLLLGLAILALASSFSSYGGSETGVHFFLWRDRTLLAFGLGVLSGVLFGLWWRGRGE